jgi:hypothetical protein
MNRLIRVLLAPLLVLALVSSTFYLGLIRPGAAEGLITSITANDTIRAEVASAFVDVIIEDEAGVIGALIRNNRQQVEAVVAETFADPAQREQLGRVAQQWLDAMLAGEVIVTLDPRPLYRPIYAAIGELLPILNFTEKDLAELDPVVLGADEPLPDLRVIRTIALVGTALWLLWLLLAAVLLRRVGRPALRTLGWQLTTIGMIGLVIVLALPRLLGSMAGDATAQVLARTVLLEITSVGVWLSLLVAVVGVAALVRSRSGERVLTSESSPDTE